MPACFINVLLEKFRTCLSMSFNCEDIVSGATALSMWQVARSWNHHEPSVATPGAVGIHLLTKIWVPQVPRIWAPGRPGTSTGRVPHPSRQVAGCHWDSPSHENLGAPGASHLGTRETTHSVPRVLDGICLVQFVSDLPGPYPAYAKSSPLSTRSGPKPLNPNAK